MSAVGSSLMACPDVQAELDNFFINCSPTEIGFRSPFNEFLLNPINRKGIQQILNPAAGKKRTVQLRYNQAIPVSEVQSGTESDITCVATTERGDLTTPYTLPDEILFVEQKYTPSFFYESCLNNEQIILKDIAMMMKALREKTYQKTADQFIDDAMWGEWGDVAKVALPATGIPGINGLEELVIKTKKDGTDDPYPTSFQTVNDALMMAQYCEAPFITGGYPFFNYAGVMQTGCCASNGIDLMKQMATYGKVVTWDKYIQAKAGLDYAFAIMPGALQIIYFEAFGGVAEIRRAMGINVGTNYETFTIIDPVSGMPMNFIMSDNCGVFSIFVWTQTKLIAMPRDMWAPGDEMAGVRFVNKIKVDNA